jgi:uncharacterized membrane protein (UPF0127 family)
MKLLASAALAALIGMLGHAARAQQAPLEDLEHFPKATLQIATAQGRQSFSIWIADTPAREEQGLMFVGSLPSAQGMLFPVVPPMVMRMWMKNTLIALDMLFIDEHGRVVYIKHDATPLSEAIITTPTAIAVKGVLELAGGECAKRRIEIGNRVLYGLFANHSNSKPNANAAANR